MNRYWTVFVACGASLLLGVVVAAAKFPWVSESVWGTATWAVLSGAAFGIATIAANHLKKSEYARHNEVRKELGKHLIGGKLFVLDDHGITALSPEQGAFEQQPEDGEYKFVLKMKQRATFRGFQRKLVSKQADRVIHGIRELFRAKASAAALQGHDWQADEVAKALSTLLAAVVGAVQREVTSASVRGESAATLVTLLDEVGRSSGKRTREEAAQQILGLVQGYTKEVETLATSYANADSNSAGWQLSDSLLLPQGTVFWSRVAGVSYLVIEYQPQIRALRFKKEAFLHEAEGFPESLKQVGRGEYVLPIALPYQVFVCSVRPGSSIKMHVFFRSKPIRSLDDALCAAALPNYYDSGQVCLGSNARITALPIREQVTHSIGQYFAAPFTSSLMEQWNKLRKYEPRCATFQAWKTNTDKDPNFVTDVSWPSTSHTIRSVLTGLVREQEAAVAAAQQSGTITPETVFANHLRQKGDQLATVLVNQLDRYKVGGSYTTQVKRIVNDQLILLLTKVQGDVSERLEAEVKALVAGVPDYVADSIARAMLVVGEDVLCETVGDLMAAADPETALNLNDVVER